MQISFQAQHFGQTRSDFVTGVVDRDFGHVSPLQVSWQALRFVNLEAQISWQAQRFANLTKRRFWWQAQRFVNLEVQILCGRHSALRTSKRRLRGRHGAL